jgi:hypothetical protein
MFTALRDWFDTIPTPASGKPEEGSVLSVWLKYGLASGIGIIFLAILASILWRTSIEAYFEFLLAQPRYSELSSREVREALTFIFNGIIPVSIIVGIIAGLFNTLFLAVHQFIIHQVILKLGGVGSFRESVVFTTPFLTQTMLIQMLVSFILSSIPLQMISTNMNYYLQNPDAIPDLSFIRTILFIGVAVVWSHKLAQVYFMERGKGCAGLFLSYIVGGISFVVFFCSLSACLPIMLSVFIRN